MGEDMINCPKCDATISFKKTTCDRCGQDLKVYKRIISASNIYYNDGLTRARIRDLSGAVISLKKSLQLNKKNTNARNLLGLVYYEMGETVAALSEWVLSKHFEANNDIADGYMNSVQSNPTRFDTINQAIKKYNSALLSAKQGSGDLAIIQLKKVISLNPRFIRAHQLLALLYMQAGEKDKALKSLMRASKIDVNNITTLRYLSELGDTGAAHTVISDTGTDKNIREESKPILPMNSYKEDKPNIFAFINLILGVIIGVAVVYFLVVPTVEKRISNEYKNNYSKYSEEQATYNSKIKTLENEKSELAKKVESLQNQIDDFEQVEIEEDLYDNIFKAAQFYLEDNKEESATALLEVKENALNNVAAKNLYDFLKNDTLITVSEELFINGRNLYNSGKYDEALEVLQQALEMNAENVDAIYFIGRAYHRLGDKDQAIVYYNRVINDFPDSGRVSEANKKLNELN